VPVVVYCTLLYRHTVYILCRYGKSVYSPRDLYMASSSCRTSCLISHRRSTQKCADSYFLFVQVFATENPSYWGLFSQKYSVAGHSCMQSGLHLCLCKFCHFYAPPCIVSVVRLELTLSGSFLRMKIKKKKYWKRKKIVLCLLNLCRIQSLCLRRQRR
jgi:hypothetical protein